MSHPKHTPGPWRFDRRNWRGEEDDRGNLYVVGDVHEPEEGDCEGYSVAVAKVEGNPTAGDTPLANARLISAAPDLLAACERALITRACDSGTRDLLRAAVDRAKGG